jgi:hypothetical protein
MKSQGNDGPGVLQTLQNPHLQIFAHNCSLRRRGKCLLNLRFQIGDHKVTYSVNSSATTCKMCDKARFSFGLLARAT